MRTIHNAAATALLFTIAACQSSNPSTTTQPDDESSDTNDSEDDESVSVTLTTAPSDSSTTDDPTNPTTGTTDEPTETTDPSADSSTTDPSADSSTSDATESSTTSQDESSTGEMLGNTIYEVQDGTIPEGSPVEIYNVIVTAVTASGFFAEEPAGGEYSGVLIFSGNGGPDTSGVSVGDIVDFSGNTFEFNDTITEVVITDGTFNLVGPGNAIDPDLVDISVFSDADMAEPWEGVFVRVEGDLVVTETITMFDEFVVTDGDPVTIDNFLYNLPDSGDFEDFDVGASFTAVQGPVNFWIDDFKVAPRSMDDLEGYAAP